MGRRTANINMKFFDKKAFTLLEIMLILGVLTTSALVLVPISRDLLKKWGSETEVYKLRNKIRETQQKAVLEQRFYSITFDLAAGNYYIAYDGDNNGTTETLVETIVPKDGVNLTGAGWGGSNPPNQVVFDQLGSPSDGGNIAFGNSNGDPVEVWIAATTGKVTINWN